MLSRIVLRVFGPQCQRVVVPTGTGPKELKPVTTYRCLIEYHWFQNHDDDTTSPEMLEAVTSWVDAALASAQQYSGVVTGPVRSYENKVEVVCVETKAIPGLRDFVIKLLQERCPSVGLQGPCTTQKVYNTFSVHLWGRTSDPDSGFQQLHVASWRLSAELTKDESEVELKQLMADAFAVTATIDGTITMASFSVDAPAQIAQVFCSLLKAACQEREIDGPYPEKQDGPKLPVGFYPLIL